MSASKRKMEEAAERWDMKVKSEQLDCNVCSTPPSYEERDVFYDTGLCSGCAANAASRD